MPGLTGRAFEQELNVNPGTTPSPGRAGPGRAITLRAAGVAAVIACVPAGCQRYERRPLDLEATRAAWLSRSPADLSVRQFAQTLASSDATAGFDPSDGLSLPEGEIVALVYNRDLRVARLAAGVTRAGADAAGRWEDPVLGLDVERVLSGAADPWVVAGTVGLTIPISGRLDAEKARAGAEHAAEIQRLAAREWATRAALRELWIEWSAQVHRARVASELVERLRGVVEIAQRQEQAGVMSRVEARLLQVELAGSEAQLIAVRFRLRELELQVRDLLGLPPQAPVQLVESIANAPRGDESAWSLASVVTDNPELAVVRAEYETAERALRLEVRRQYPDLSIGPGYGSDQGDDRALLGLRLPIPFWNRNLKGVGEAAARREAARGRFESTYEHLASRLEIARARYQAGRALREAVEAHVLPLADDQDADVRRVAELGRVEPLLLLQAIKAQYDAKVKLIDARAAESVGAVRLDELIGPAATRPEQTEKQSSTGDRP